MIINSDIVGIIADDLTGANDTALQFHLKGANTQILLNDNIDLLNIKGTQTWAIATETRNVNSKEAYDKVFKTTETIVKKVNPDYFYKKIDSTIRGNIAIEILAVLGALNWEASIICPAFPAESRVTIGGYHLLKGIPIERTEMARDPHKPIMESHIPTLLKSQLTQEYEDLVGHIELRTIIKGAGPILMEVNRLIKEGKKLIVADAASTTDIEQVALAIYKSDYKILPSGSAALAGCMSELWFADMENQRISKQFPKLPKFIISGSSTNITSSQLDKLDQTDEFDNILMINLDLQSILNGVSEELVERCVNNLDKNYVVVVNTSHLIINFDGFSDESLNADLTKATLATTITDFLAELAQRVTERKEVILITLGGETSYTCCHAIGAEQLQLIDEVAPAIPLCMDHNARWIVTKSGNLGNNNTLIDIIRYFNAHDTQE